MKTFNILESPWIKVISNQGIESEVSMFEIFCHSQEYHRITDEFYPTIMGVYRVLLSYLHRAIRGPATPQQWLELWNSGSFDPVWDHIQAYGQQWFERFFLVHEEYPFYQVSTLQIKNPNSISKIDFARSCGNNPAFFDIRFDSDATTMGFAEAVRLLITHQNFTVGGFITPFCTEEFKASTLKSFAGPLSGVAPVLVVGKNVFETLMLNLIKYDPTENNIDQPAWERDYIIELPETRKIFGYTDYMTWQSRSIKLFLDESKHCISHVTIMDGYTLDDKDKIIDPMVAYKFAKNIRIPIRFRTDAFILDDFTSILMASDSSHPPLSVSWLHEIANFSKGILDRNDLQLHFIGIISSKAKLEGVKREIFPYKVGEEFALGVQAMGKTHYGEFMRRKEELQKYLLYYNKHLYHRYIIPEKPVPKDELKMILKKAEGLILNYYITVSAHFVKYLKRAIHSGFSTEIQKEWKKLCFSAAKKMVVTLVRSPYYRSIMVNSQIAKIPKISIGSVAGSIDDIDEKFNTEIEILDFEPEEFEELTLDELDFDMDEILKDEEEEKSDDF